MKMFRRRSPETENGKVTLADGLFLHMGEVEERESRILTLLLKGFLVYLIVMGSIGCFLTSLDIRCVWWVIHLGVLLGAVYCSLLYYNKIWQNIGYILLLLFMLALGVWLRSYISSGVFAVANRLTERASIFFESSALKTYKEQITNHQVTIPIAMCYIGWVISAVLNVLISRRMNYVAVALLCLVSLFVPLYLEREPSAFYVVMLTAGLLVTFILRKNGHYRLSLKDRRYEYEPKKKRISYIYAGKTAVVLVVMAVVMNLATVRILDTFYPKEDYAGVRSRSAMKESTMDVMENLTMLGIMGLFNYYPNTGGLVNGTLGGVSAVQRDFETDLTVTYVPYSFQRLYLKTFTGGRYLPRANRWSRTIERRQMLGLTGDDTVDGYRSFYESGVEKSAKGRMLITNVAAAPGVYLPYYSADTWKSVAVGETQEYEYYPPVGNLSLKLPSEYSYEYRIVPEENRQVVRELCREAGLYGVSYGNVDEVVKKLTAYFQANIPYTLRPGATPYREDFVNYFLTKNRRGYCAHFASAATLAFRCMGIPARYVEGYAIDSLNIQEDGTVLSAEQVEDYYKGYLPMGDSAVVSVDVTDASAHAWVEVYDSEHGWRPVEVTPASTESGGEDGGLWQRLLNFLISDAGTDNSQGADSEGGDQTDTDAGSEILSSIGRFAGGLLVIVVVLVILFFVLRKAVRRLVWQYRYRHAGVNDKLIMRYHAYIRRIMRRRSIRRMQQENGGNSLAETINYREQLQWLVSHDVWEIGQQELERAVALLEQAGFSAEEIAEEDLRWMLTLM